uniref:Primary cilia formation n=1 Tax=Anser cygnoides TaxID=8845 RepID=A0A8B9D839_ANSCY
CCFTMTDRISFGSCQERKTFPLHHAPDRLGIQLGAIKGNPFLGPGCYQSQEVSCLTFLLRAFPSQKTHIIRKLALEPARHRVPHACPAKPLYKTVTPGPGTYQSFWNKDRKCQPSHAPFSSKTSRFPDKPSNKELFPGPGTYDTDKQLHKKITWPMKFGSPDWSLVPMPAKRMLKTELMVDREFIKHRNRVAYLSLYES